MTWRKMNRTRDYVKQSNSGSEPQMHVFYHILSMWVCVYMCMYVYVPVGLPVGLEKQKETLNEWWKVLGIIEFIWFRKRKGPIKKAGVMKVWERN